MISWSSIPWILQIPHLVCAFGDSECYFRVKDFRRDGNVMIGAFFPLYYYYTANKIPHKILPNHFEDFYLQYKFKNYQFVLALVFAIEEINRNHHLLPNTSLGFDLYNIPFSEKNTLMNAFIWLTGINDFKANYNCKKEQKLAAALTGTSFAVSAHMGTLFQLYKMPQLTFGPFNTILSDRTQFTSLYQMSPSDISLPRGIVSLMLHFKWSWVGLIFTDDHRGMQILSDMKQEMKKNKVCVAFVEMISGTWDSFSHKFWKSLGKIQDSSANVIIIFGDTDSLQGVMKNIGQKLTTWKVWVMNSQWDVTNHIDYFMLDSFHGSLTFSHHYEEIVEFENFIQTVQPSKYPEDTYLPKLWHLFFKCPFSHSDCKLENCQPNASLDLLPKQNFDTAMSEESYYIYNAVYTVAHSLHTMILKQIQIQQHKNGAEIVFLPWQLHPLLQNKYMNNHVGSHMEMDMKSKLDSKYDIINFWNFPKGIGLKVKVGSFSPNAPHDQQLSLTNHLIQWPTRFTEIPTSVCTNLCQPGFRRTVKEGQDLCCFDCTSCPDNEISNETDMDHCVKCPGSHYANTEKNHCLEKAVTFLNFEDPLGMALSSTALCLSAITATVLGIFVKHRDTPIVKANNRALSYILLITLIICFLSSLFFIGQPNTVTCILQQMTFAILFTMALSTVLAKALTVVIAFKVTFPGRLMRWLIISRATNYIIPIFTLLQIILCGIWLGTSPPFVDQDTHAQHGHIIILCNKGSAIAFHCVLGYLCSLALGSYTMAFLSRNLPDKFNEAKFLTFSMLVFFSVWVTFLPVYHSTKGKFMVAVEVFSILASSAALLGFIFAPKCYIILLKPDKNMFHGIRDNTHYRRNDFN
ncbi:vomeronasal type-2 receptor 116-like [Mesocricetus auratus]|uniref:Vomeronasal type-2 receptor 116-like n=1 Tax=Mesocricetus auratus TaxID=10036 RepID=A0ABM2WIJ5_MESAU|nr:vomeronasal type-2 receptor 116-like [Mesocricetus auratus]